MIYVTGYFIIATIILSFAMYFLGKSETTDDDTGAAVFMIVVASVCWLLILGVGIILLPFIGLYCLGKKHKKNSLEKAKALETLKK